MTRASDGHAGASPDPVTEMVRAADLRVRAPQSAIPTQGGPPLLPPPRSGPPPMGPMLGPPSGPARRSPMLNPHGRPTPQHPSGEQAPMDDDVSVPLKVRLAAQWRSAREVAKTPPGRWTLIGVAAVLQVFLLFSTVMWWTGGTSSITAASSVAPMTWTGIVYDVGAAGVNLRSATAVDPANAKDTAARGSRLAVQCGQTGDEVAKGNVHTATWLKTTDGLFVSMLYVRVPDRQSIPSCSDSTVDAPLLALADPANPSLPPPPGTALGASDPTTGASNGARRDAAGRPRVVAAPGRAPAAAGSAPTVPGGASRQVIPGTDQVGTATVDNHNNVPADGNDNNIHDHDVTGDGNGSATAFGSGAATTLPDPDTTPVG